MYLRKLFIIIIIIIYVIITTYHLLERKCESIMWPPTFKPYEQKTSLVLVCHILFLIGEKDVNNCAQWNLFCFPNSAATSIVFLSPFISFTYQIILISKVFSFSTLRPHYYACRKYKLQQLHEQVGKKLIKSSIAM